MIKMYFRHLGTDLLSCAVFWFAILTVPADKSLVTFSRSSYNEESKRKREEASLKEFRCNKSTRRSSAKKGASNIMEEITKMMSK